MILSEPVCVIVMGVSGSGKSLLARGLADRLGWPFLEGDDLHPPANVDAMASGTPLTDEDRGPWLDRVGAWVDEQRRADTSAVVTCSALRRSYRDRLRAGRPGVLFCHVTADPAVLERRMRARQGHFMPPSLLPSQLAVLEPLGPDEPGLTLSSDAGPDDVVSEMVRRLGLRAAGPGGSVGPPPPG
jgi:gluconokinase